MSAKATKSATKKRNGRGIILSISAVAIAIVAIVCVFLFCHGSVKEYEGTDIPYDSVCSDFGLYPGGEYSMTRYIEDGDDKSLYFDCLNLSDGTRFICSNFINCSYRAVYRNGIAYVYDEATKTNTPAGASAPTIDGLTAVEAYHITSESGIESDVFFFRGDDGSLSGLLKTKA